MHINFVKKGQLWLLLSFAGLIVGGALLLSLPGILPQGRLSFTDAVFTSCTAVCLCGLETVPVAGFTFFGQLVILLLIQSGCFGILTLTAMLLLMINRTLSFSNTLMLSNLNDRFTLRGAEGLTRTVVHYTLISEAVGALLMFPAFLWSGSGFWKSLWYSCFLSVGSFCNSGLSPLAGSMSNVNLAVRSISVGLMILGGLGVYVIYDIVQVINKRNDRLRLHSRIVLWTTGILLISGTFLLWLLSRTDTVTVRLGWLDAIFLSATSRTTGYMTIDPGLMSSSCQMLLIVLMLIGGSPGSTAGGMKTSTLAVVIAALSASFKGENEVLVGKRTIPISNVLRAFTIMVLFILISSAGAMLLKSLTPGREAIKCFFEAASALSTTGLSMGNTTVQWGSGCKWLIILFMFAGRVGPLTIILFFAGREKHNKLHYPEEQVVVG